MVEHPDYDLQRQREQSVHTTAAAITCGMVAVACGFACCENFLYIFGEGVSLSGGTLVREFACLVTVCLGFLIYFLHIRVFHRT